LEPPFGARDPHGMAALLQAQPEHIEAALARGDASPWKPPLASPSLLALGGMGGSAIAGELTAAAAWDRMPRPFLLVRDYHWPAWAGRDALAVLSSNSGRTEETLSLAREAAARGMPAMAMSSGGPSPRWRPRTAGCSTGAGGAAARAALFHAWVPLTRLLADLGWTDDPTAAWKEAPRYCACSSGGGRTSPNRPTPPSSLPGSSRAARCTCGRDPGRWPRARSAGDSSSTKMLRCSPIPQ
jgi:hypothetical protein